MRGHLLCVLTRNACVILHLHRFTALYPPMHFYSRPTNWSQYFQIWQEMHLSTVQVPIDFGLDWPWCPVSFSISNIFLPKFAFHYLFASVCIYLMWPSPVGGAHSTWHRTYTDYSMHEDNVAPWAVKQYSFISWWDHRSAISRRLGDWHWILQAPIGSRQIIHTTHAVILYANIQQSQKQQ